MELEMFNLIVSLACVTVCVSLWGILFFIWRIIVRRKVMYDTFNMPSSAELHELYERLNKQIVDPFREDVSSH